MCSHRFQGLSHSLDTRTHVNFSQQRLLGGDVFKQVECGKVGDVACGHGAGEQLFELGGQGQCRQFRFTEDVQQPAAFSLQVDFQRMRFFKGNEFGRAVGLARVLAENAARRRP